VRIARVIKYLPTIDRHPGGLHVYFLTRYIQAPTLIIAKREAETPLAFPPHADIHTVAYRDLPFTSRVEDAFAGGGGSARRTLLVLLRLAAKARELAAFAGAVPALVRFRPDLVHVHGVLAVIPGMFAKAVLRSGFVLTIHGASEVVLLQRSRLLRACVGYADRVLCVSQPLRDALDGPLSAEILRVIPTAFEPSIFTNERRPRREQLVAVGHFKWQKGYQYMLRAMVEVAARRPACRLLIIGDGPERPRLEAEIVRLGLSGRVVLLGAVSQAEVARHLNDSRLFVMSALSEGLPKAVLEAAACGTPAVVTTACNVGDIIDRIGVAVAPRDPVVFAEAVITLLDDEARWQRLSEGGREVARGYEWRAIAERVAHVYDEVVRAPAADNAYAQR
jgi:glycosyltransferase involved in cell wall biosynthesis